MDMKKHQTEIRVYFGDCDPAQIVYYPNYFRWFDHATTEYFATVGLDMKTLFTQYGIVGVPILDTGANFLKPSTFRDIITIETHISEWGRSSFRLQHVIYNDGVKSVQGHEVRAWVGRDSQDKLKALPLPEEVKQAFLK